MKRLWTLSCIMVLALASLASAQITFDFTGGGARAEGMGRAYYGLSDDVRALGWNPAGLIALERPILGISYGTVRPRGAFETSSRRFSEFGSFNNVRDVSFLAPVRIRAHQFVLSAAYAQAAEDYSFEQADWRQDSIPNEWLPNTTYDMRVQAQTVDHYNPYMINFGFGTPIMKNLSMGLAVNIYTGRAVNNARVNMVATGYRPGDRLLQAVTRDSSITFLDTAKYSGVNFTFGFKYTMARMTTGLVVKSGYSLDYLVDRKIADSVRYNDFVKSGVTVYQDDQLTRLEIPWVVGLGIGYKLTENWLLSGDFEYRPYSGRQIKQRTSIKIGSGGNTEETFTTYDPQWYNAFVLRAGTEYMKKLKSRFFPLVPLRCGLGYIPVPTPDIAIDGSTVKTTMYTLSAGTGVYFSQIHLDLAYVLTIHDRSIFDVIYNENGSYVYWTGEVKNRLHQLNLSFTGYF